MKSLLEFIWKLITRPTKHGYLIISSGQDNVFIHTCFTPRSVWINLPSPRFLPVCGTSNDKFEVKIVKHGFIIVYNIQSEQRKIHWLAID